MGRVHGAREGSTLKLTHKACITAMAEDLAALQNKIKRDPDSYEDEFAMQYRHFESSLELTKLKPQAASKDFSLLVMFCCHLAPNFLTLTAELPQKLMSLLEEHSSVIPSRIRKDLCSGLILLRNRGMLDPVDLLPLFFRLFRCHDKALRTQLFSHIVNDVSGLNKKQKNNKVNSVLQNFMFRMVNDNNVIAARFSLKVITTLYRRSVWTDTKTANVVAAACFSKHPQLLVRAIRFFLGADDLDDDEMDSDDEALQTEVTSVAKDAFNIHHKHTAPSQKKLRNYKRAIKRVKSNEGKSRKSRPMATSTAIHLLHDPQAFVEKLFNKLKSSNESFEIKLMMMDLISRCVGTHDLLLMNFYPFLQKYLSPHQKEITKILAAIVQACHDLVPPDCLHPIILTLASKFVSDRCSNEAMAIGLNTIREICSRQALVMTEELLQDLAQYKSTKEKGVASAARSLIQLFRELCPSLLHKKDRGKGHEMDKQVKDYGASTVADNVAGLELLLDEPAADEESEDDSSGQEFDMSEDEEGSDDQEDDDDQEMEQAQEEEQGTAAEAEAEAQVQKQKVEELVGDRILTDKDFSKIRRKQLMAQVQKMRGANKIQGQKRKLEDLAEMDDEELEEEVGDEDGAKPAISKVDPHELQSRHKKKKLTKAERVACIMEGREGREKFGRVSKKGGGTTNKVKCKKKSLMMKLMSSQVQDKSKRSSKETTAVKRAHRVAQKSKARTKRNDARSKKKK